MLKYNYEQLMDMSDIQLDAVELILKEELHQKQVEKYQKVNRILFYQHKLEK